MKAGQATYITVIGGALVALGSLLPWVTAQSGLGSVSIAGTDGDGIFTLVMGGAIAIAALPLGGGDRVRAVVVMLSMGALLLGLVELQNVQGRIGDINSDVVRGSVGIGLWVVISGAVVAVIGSIMMARARPGTPPASW